MAEQDIQKQINEINDKLDLLLGYVNDQRLKSQAIEDLIDDVSLIGKEVFDSSVTVLEEQQVSIDPEKIQLLAIKFLKNIDNFHNVMNLFESASDFVKDAEPIFNEVMIDAVKALHQFEQKGYFEFFRQLATIFDRVVTHFGKDDLESLADNIVGILEMLKNVTQPEVVSAINNGINIYKNLDNKNVEPMSIWKVVRELNTPEMKQSIGFLITFLKNISKQ